jgi:hypothetical protein
MTRAITIPGRPAGDVLERDIDGRAAAVGALAVFFHLGHLAIWVRIILAAAGEAG